MHSIFLCLSGNSKKGEEYETKNYFSNTGLMLPVYRMPKRNAAAPKPYCHQSHSKLQRRGFGGISYRRKDPRYAGVPAGLGASPTVFWEASTRAALAPCFHPGSDLCRRSHKTLSAGKPPLCPLRKRPLEGAFHRALRRIIPCASGLSSGCIPATCFSQFGS